MSRASSADEEFERVIAAHGAALRRLAATYTKGTSDRDDLLQDIAVAIWRALPNFRGESSERTFIFRIAHNRGIAHVTRRRLPLTEADELSGVVDRGPDPEAVFRQGQLGRRLFAAVQRLPLSYRQVISLTLEDLTYAEIAEVLGISEANVGVRLTRARHLLRQWLQE
jgi:RNA polymerase sigma-70 factor (ECF subfamily)